MGNTDKTYVLKSEPPTSASYTVALCKFIFD